jgi:leucyl-tRNA synthetase
MFMGPLADSKPWNPRDIPGCRRFLERAWRVFVDEDSEVPVRPELLEERPVAGPETEALERAWNQALARIDDSFARFNFNTAIAAFMSFVNEATKRPGALVRSQAERFVRALSPFAPHLAEELWSRLGHTNLVCRAPWPELDPRWLAADDFELIVQVLGKVRGKVRAPKDATEDELARLAREVVADRLEGRELIKTIVVPGRLVNLVVR